MAFNPIISTILGTTHLVAYPGRIFLRRLPSSTDRLLPFPVGSPAPVVAVTQAINEILERTSSLYSAIIFTEITI